MPVIKLSKTRPGDTLNLLYCLFNRFLFDNKLPPIPVKASKKVGDMGLAGFLWFIEDDVTGSREGHSILIDPKHPDPAKVLLHEMCHAYHRLVMGINDPRDHPPSFVRLLKSKYKKMGFEVDPEDVTDSVPPIRG